MTSKWNSRKLVATLFGVLSVWYLSKNPNEVSRRAVDLIGQLVAVYVGGQAVVDAVGAKQK